MRFHMNTLEPPDSNDAIIEAYESSEEFVTDALDWAIENPTPELIEAALDPYRASARYATALDDIEADERTVA